MPFELQKLPFPYDALEPHIDVDTMKIHHTKHHASYVNKLNEAIAGTPMADMTIEEIFQAMGDNAAIRNNAGGVYNHSLFWEIMSPTGGKEPSGDLATAINSVYTSFDSFKSKFSNIAATRFGSGWAWLCVQKGGGVEICSTPNQDNPLMVSTGCGGIPILGLDVWEHAYYLNYQNRRPDYITAFWNIVNWDEVARRYALYQ